jgi:bacterioferritin
VQTSVIDQKVLGYLGRALSLELSAVQMYATQARLVGNWGLEQAADRFRHEAHEEMQHVEKIIARMLAKGVAPNASQLRPVKLGGDLVQLLQVNQRFEMDLVGLYRDAVDRIARSKFAGPATKQGQLWSLNQPAEYWNMAIVLQEA